MNNLCPASITFESLKGNPLASLTPLQSALKPFVGDLLIVWWIVWISVLVFLVIRFLVPSLRAKTG